MYIQQYKQIMSVRTQKQTNKPNKLKLN